MKALNAISANLLVIPAQAGTQSGSSTKLRMTPVDMLVKTLVKALLFSTQSTDVSKYLTSQVFFMPSFCTVVAQYIDSFYQIQSPTSTSPTNKTIKYLIEGVVMRLSIYLLPSTIRYPFTVFRFHWPLIIDNLLKIENCKLLIAAPKGGAL